MKSIKGYLITVLIIALTFASMGAAFAAESEMGSFQEASIEDALSYLHRVQNSDGGFPSREGRESSLAVTTWVIMALASAGEDANGSDWMPLQKSPVDYLLASESALEYTTDDARILLALSSSGKGSVYQGVDLLEKLKGIQSLDGQFARAGIEDEMINAHMWTILALKSADVTIPNSLKAKEWLISNQNQDGGFGWLIGGESDSDDTAIAIQALMALGEDPESSPVISSAFDFIKKHQNSDGGFSSSDTMGVESNTATASWIMQSIYAVSEDPSDDDWSYGGRSPLEFLLSMQNTDGSFNWKDDVDSSKIQMSAYAIMALSQKSIPVNIDYQAKAFTDFSREHWAYEIVMDLVENSVISGYLDGTFKPENQVSRAEFTSMAINGLNLQNMVPEKAIGFSDVSKSFWAYKTISIAYDMGIIFGKSTEVFDPNGKITGAELATMMVNCLTEEERSKVMPGEYWYSGYVNLARQLNLLYPDLDATEYATRAECAYSISKIREHLSD